MPSSNIRDDLPSYYNRVHLLRQVAAAVISSMPRVARRSGLRGAVVPQPEACASDAPAEQQRALPGSPHRPYSADMRTSRRRT